MKKLVIIKGGGDLATGVASRLHRSSFAIIMTELPQPTVVRRTVAFAQAVYSGEHIVEGVKAVKANISEAPIILAAGEIPIVTAQTEACLKKYQPYALIDATIAKRNTGTSIKDASLVIGLGPGFTAGYDVHAVIETMRGHELGRVITSGATIANTGIPGEIGGYTTERLLRAPCAGAFRSVNEIGDMIVAGQVVAYVAKKPVIAAINGVLRGLINNGCVVHQGMKIGDIDPRCKKEQCITISDKARAVAGGVLEALLWLGGRE